MHRAAHVTGGDKFKFHFFAVPDHENQASGLAAGGKKGRRFNRGVTNLGEMQLEIVFTFTKQVFRILPVHFLQPVFGLLFREQPQSQRDQISSRTEQRSQGRQS